MDVWTYAIGTASLATAPVYLYVAWRLQQRPVPTAARLASVQFSLWWAGLGFQILIAGVEGIAAGLGILDFPTAFTGYLLTVLIDTVALWGLVGYLLYIYTGKYHLLALGAFYAAFYIAALDYIVSSEPYAVSLMTGGPVIVYHLMATGPVLAFVVFGLLVPELAGAILYLSLLRRTTDRTRRYRIGMVSASLWLYFGLAFLGTPSVLSPPAWGFVKAILDVAAALLSLVAFFPPSSVQRRLHVDAVPGGAGGGGGAGW